MPVSHSVLTVVAAPMGYGKTTAVNWYLNKLSKSEKTFIIRISIYSDNVSVFWQSVQKAFSFAGLDFLNINQIYSKLMINGDTRTKRKQLIELISSIKQ